MSFGYQYIVHYVYSICYLFNAIKLNTEDKFNYPVQLYIIYGE